MPLEPTKLLAEIEKRYEETSKQEKANFLIYGRAGSGKSHLISTAPGPILIHSFDPGGTRTIRALLDAGLKKKIYIDTRFEHEMSRKGSPSKGRPGFASEGPYAYKLWETEFNTLSKNNVFDGLGTYVIDSGTGWLDAMLNEICQQEGRRYAETQIQDYNKLQFFVADALSEVTNIPCNFIMTGHIDSYQDKGDGKTYFSLLASGKGKVKIPSKFDEFYYLSAKEENGKIIRKLLTTINGKHEARTRIGSGKFDMYEEPDVKKLLKKAGYSHEDKQN
jgi:hypothetical protein